MLKTILSVLSGLFGLVTRWFDWKHDPERLRKEDANENAKIIASGDADKLNERLDSKLR